MPSVRIVTLWLLRYYGVLGVLGPRHISDADRIFSVETEQMSSVETEQMSAVETGQMSAAETEQISSVEIG